MTSFTAYYSVHDPNVGQSAITTTFRGVGILSLVLAIFLSIYFNAKEDPKGMDFKKTLQEGMKTGLLAIVLYSIYNYFYLSSFNPDYIERLVNFRIEAIEASASDQALKDQQIAQVAENLAPFKRVTQDVLKLLAISSMGAFMGSVLLKFWTQRFSL